MTLPTRPLGMSGMEITVVGLGTWAIGGGGWLYGWGAQRDEESLATMRRAVDAGISWFDTAGVYGHGHSEEVVGRFLCDLPEADRPLVFTKCGPVWDPDDHMKDEPSDLRPETIRRQCEDSLRRLGVERLDLLQFHWPSDVDVPIEESWGEMSRLIDEGMVRAGGVSNFDYGLLDRCEEIRHVDSLQNHFSLISREAALEEIPWARDHATGFLCYSPMESGQLTDAFSREKLKALDPEDWRGRDKDFREPSLSRNLALRDGLTLVAQRHGASVAAVALAWTLSWDGVTAAIAGARRPDQIDGWIDAAALVLDRRDLDEIGAALVTTGAGEGPRTDPTGPAPSTSAR